MNEKKNVIDKYNYEVIIKNVKNRYKIHNRICLNCTENKHPSLGFNPFSTETVLLVGYWSPITDTLILA